jgi:hypothetical protein
MEKRRKKIIEKEVGKGRKVENRKVEGERRKGECKKCVGMSAKVGRG